MSKKISSKFPFESKYIKIKGYKMHYIDEGRGDPILFLHGNPTSSYLWRNIIPYLENQGRCIAPDLIGMGKSGKPDIGYTYDDHYEYLVEFIEKLKLKNITLVIHDWGSGLGFRYAYDHKKNIKGIAFMEGMYKSLEWGDIPSQVKIQFKMMRTPFIGFFMISVLNMFVKMMIPKMVVRKLNKEEMDYYSAPYKSIKDRKPVRVWPMHVPIGGKPKRSHELVKEYSDWLKKSDIPKLMFYGHPGALIKESDVKWIKNNFANLKSVDIGDGMHYIQEDNPHKIGEELSNWYSTL